jgi:hypothetical protein
MGSISRLEAINHMLLLAGEAPVNEPFEEDGHFDTEIASKVLDQHIRDTQLRGLVNNKYEKKFVHTSGSIELPSVCLSAELVSIHTNDDGFRILGTVRGDVLKKLWNITDQTYTWPADDYWIELIEELAWIDLDTPIQRSIMSSAARQYQIMVLGDHNVDQYLAEMSLMARIRAKAADIDDKRRNIFQSVSRSQKDVLYNRPSSSTGNNIRKG